MASRVVRGITGRQAWGVASGYKKPEVLGVLACGTASARPQNGVTQRGALDLLAARTPRHGCDVLAAFGSVEVAGTQIQAAWVIHTAGRRPIGRVQAAVSLGWLPGAPRSYTCYLGLAREFVRPCVPSDFGQQRRTRVRCRVKKKSSTSLHVVSTVSESRGGVSSLPFVSATAFLPNVGRQNSRQATSIAKDGLTKSDAKAYADVAETSKQKRRLKWKLLPKAAKRSIDRTPRQQTGFCAKTIQQGKSTWRSVNSSSQAILKWASGQGCEWHKSSGHDAQSE